MKPLYQVVIAVVITALIVASLTYLAIGGAPPATITKTVTATAPPSGEEYTVTKTEYVGEITKTVTTTVSVGAPRKIKAAWIYVGPIGDYGWTFAHDRGRRIVEDMFPWLETLYVEKVAEGQEYDIIKRLIEEQGVDVVFTTSFGFMNGTLRAAKEYPDHIFFHCSGYLRWKNMGTYFADLYQVYYLNGLMAGALTKSNKVGYVAAHPIPEVIRHIDAFALGVKEVNPDAKVYVVWIHAWYAPDKARQAAEALIAQGIDVIAFTEDTPTVIEVAEEYYKRGHPVYSFSHYSPMLDRGPDVVVSGQLVHWEVIYADILAKIYSGVYTNTNLENVDYWWLLNRDAVELGADYGVPINPKFVPILKDIKVKEKITGEEISVYDLVMLRLKQMKEENPTFDPFCAIKEPIMDQQGNVRVPVGLCLGHDELWSIMWFVDNVVGEIPAGAGE